VAQSLEAALIAASASIAVGAVAAYASAFQGKRTRALQQKLADDQRGLQHGLAQKQHEFDTRLAQFQDALEREAKVEERALDAQQALERFSMPLQLAAEDLGHRISNIRTGSFLVYVDEPNRRREIAVLGTIYRFARFFATLEMLYDQAEFLILERQLRGDSRKESVVQTLAAIGRAFASDRYDLVDDQDLPASQLMIWREEQRAMGELARVGDRDAVVGFATFATRAAGEDARWFANLKNDLEAGAAPESQRLELIQSLLAKLVRLLDRSNSYLVEGEEPEWMREVPTDPATITVPRRREPGSGRSSAVPR
jgi:hypothetical protein